MPEQHPPSVDRLARSLVPTGLPHPIRVEIARQAIELGRVEAAGDLAEERRRRLLIPVVNATGTLLHTNLGRAPIEFAPEAGYHNVELDLASGDRGSRQRSIGETAALACGADAAMVVNNCASALLLVLAALAEGRGVAVSRGELVEIGGAFRIPDVMRRSGAQLIEVGTTNRSRLADYRRAAELGDLAVVLRVHQSNYRITGFAEETSIGELATLGPPVVADIGSGLLDSSCPWLDGPPPSWLAGEPAARQTLAAGADLVVFSGDKLMGGPQAGVIAGRADLVDACGRHPLARALRPGGLVLAALQETLLHYLHRRGSAIPFWRMATWPVADLRRRADAILQQVASEQLRAIDTHAVPGGGTLPGRTIPSAGIGCGHDVTERLRAADPPVIARVQDGATIIDLRTVDPSDDDHLTASLSSAVKGLA